MNCKKNIFISCTVVLIAFITLSQNSNAQDFELAGIKYAYYPKAAIKDVSENREISFHEFNAFVNIPMKFKNQKTGLVHGFGYGFVEAAFNNSSPDEASKPKKNLHAFYYQLRLVHKWNEKWSLLVALKPTIASDFEQKLSSEDLIFQGAVIATRTINNKLKIGAGVVYGAQWGSPRVLPVVSINYKNDRHSLNTLLPMDIKYTYSLFPEEKLKLGLRYTRNGANFNVSGSDMAEIDKINYSRANIGVLANYKLTTILRIEAFGGISTGRKYRFVDFDNNEHDFDSKAAPFFSVGIVFVSPQI
ncbi:MAG: hypothetical protein JEY94_00935 [Melioribacteraceae bacterium]|nr:hypothetical protein [Melioribacteraceae bacterium]